MHKKIELAKVNNTEAYKTNRKTTKTTTTVETEGRLQVVICHLNFIE